MINQFSLKSIKAILQTVSPASPAETRKDYNTNNNDNNNNNNVEQDPEAQFSAAEQINLEAKPLHVCNCENVSQYNASIIENCPLHKQAVEIQSKVANDNNNDNNNNVSFPTSQTPPPPQSTTIVSARDQGFYQHPLVAGIPRGGLTAESRARAKALLEGSTFYNPPSPPKDFHECLDRLQLNNINDNTTNNINNDNATSKTDTFTTSTSYHLPGLAPTVSDYGYYTNDVFTNPDAFEMFRSDDSILAEAQTPSFNWDAFHCASIDSDEDDVTMTTLRSPAPIPTSTPVSAVWKDNSNDKTSSALYQASDPNDEVYAWTNEDCVEGSDTDADKNTNSSKRDEDVYSFYTTETSLGWDGCFYGNGHDTSSYDNINVADDADDDSTYYFNDSDVYSHENQNYSDMV